VVALGKIAWDAALRRALRVAPDEVPRPRPVFGHGSRVLLALRAAGASTWLVGSYHPSQQNTQTGRLTRRMFDSVVSRAIDLAA
jgi:uracil-DNA glycosylase